MKNIKELPSFLNDFLNKKNYKLEQIIQFNPRKFSYVLKVKKNNKFYLLKTFDESKSPSEVKRKFQIEKEFYEKNEHLTQIPRLIDYDNNTLTLEYVEGISLRDHIIAKSDKTRTLVNLVNEIENFRENVYSKNALKYFDNVYRYISVLGNSHPFQARNIKVNTFDKILNKLVTKLLKLRVEKTLNSDNIDMNNLKLGFSHNDFHYNNILISRDKQIKFIDFENIEYKGFFEFDILFLVVMIEIYLNKRERQITDRYLRKLFSKNDILEYIYCIYKTAISMNKKFYLYSNSNNLGFFQKLILLLGKERCGEK